MSIINFKESSTKVWMQKLTLFLKLIVALLRVERQAAINQVLGTFCCDTKNRETWNISSISLFHCKIPGYDISLMQNAEEEEKGVDMEIMIQNLVQGAEIRKKCEQM